MQPTPYILYSMDPRWSPSNLIPSNDLRSHTQKTVLSLLSGLSSHCVCSILCRLILQYAQNLCFCLKSPKLKDKHSKGATSLSCIFNSLKVLQLSTKYLLIHAVSPNLPTEHQCLRLRSSLLWV